MPKTDIPPEILAAVNTILSPYGVSYSAPVRRGYTNYKGAAKYTGLSVSTLRRMVEAGELAIFRPTGSAAVRFSYESLDAIMK